MFTDEKGGIMTESPIEILSTRVLTDAQLDHLRAVAPELRVRQVTTDDPATMRAAMTPTTAVLLTFRCDFDVRQTPSLRWVQVESAGVDTLRGTSLWQSDIAITSANGVHTVQIAEHVMALLLALGHHLPLAQRYQERAAWAPATEHPALTARELRGMTLGILGYGAIGRQVARLATAFGMTILATKRADASPVFTGWTPAGMGDHDGTLPRRYYALEELPAMLPQCDAIVLALPLTDATRHIMNDAMLRRLPPHAWVVNISRGGVLDHDALARLLADGRLGGAALDVTEPEPLPASSPLWRDPNVIITPHISGLSAHYAERVTELFAANLRRFLAGAPLLNLVDRERGY